jgi:hypothetical protein
VKPVVLSSIETPEGDRCVDIFERENGTFGFEEWRRDPESASGWFAIGFHADKVFESQDAALADARVRVTWLVDSRVRDKDGS